MSLRVNCDNRVFVVAEELVPDEEAGDAARRQVADVENRDFLEVRRFGKEIGPYLDAAKATGFTDGAWPPSGTAMALAAASA